MPTDVQFRLMSASDLQATAAMLAAVFSRDEPLAVAVQQDPAEIGQLVSVIGAKAVEERLAFVAHDGAGEVLGAILVHDFGSPLPDAMGSIGPTSLPIVALLEELESTCPALHDVRPGAHAHIFMIGVAPGAAGRGIAGRLLSMALANAKERGYRYAFTEATGSGSERVFRRAGFRELASIGYRTFEFEGRRPFSTIDAPESALLMELQF